MKGVTVTLKQKIQDGTDPFGQPIFTTKDIEVNDVLVGEPSSTDIETMLNLYGKRIAYTLALPKGDANTWFKCQVVLPAPWSATFNVIGDFTAGIEQNVPTRWNKKVHLERAEG